jgi:hypothetical protein
MRFRGILCLLLLVGLGPAALLAQEAPALSLEERQAAIDAAKGTAPIAPYVIQSRVRTGSDGHRLSPGEIEALGVDPPVRVHGALYTPFIRAALYARKEMDAGRVVTPADIPAEYLEPLAYVLMVPFDRWANEEADRLVDPLHLVVAPTGGAAAPRSVDRSKVIQPVWVKPDTELLRRLFGDQVPVRGHTAAFRPDVIRPGWDFVFVYAGSGVYAQWREITPEDVTSWR